MTPRSYLYVPATRPERFRKAAESGADAVILDLEDAVPLTQKDAARDNAVAYLRGRPDHEVVVRVNGGSLLEADMLAVVEAGARVVSLPKASADELARLDGMLGTSAPSVVALVETAQGVLDARAIAEHPLVERLAIGEADLGAELGVQAAEAFATARGLVILASAAAGLEPPVAPVSTDFRDLEAFAVSSRALRDVGFGARAAIHPDQVATINTVFTPAAEEVERARKLLADFETAGGGVFVAEDGRMVDEAVVRAARRVLALAEPRNGS